MTAPIPRRRSSVRGVRGVRVLAATLAAVLVGAVLVGGALAATPGPAAADWAPADPTSPATPPTVSADALPTVQINGVVWSQATRGDVVYAGGDFTEARPPGVAEGGAGSRPRSHLVAFDVTTGAMTDFAPAFNQQVRAVAVSPDGRRLYVGGDFTEVDGERRSRFAAFDLPGGQLVEELAPQVSNTVTALAATNDAVYLGGSFGAVGTLGRGGLAALNAVGGGIRPWAPEVSGGGVSALTVSPDGSRVAVGGSFTEVDDDPGPADGTGDGLALLDASTGAAYPLPAGEHIHNRNGEDDNDGAITTLAADANAFYGAGYTYGSVDAGTMEGTFAVNWDGTVRWIADCHGDSYSVHPQGEVVYVASHTHYCENMGGVRQGAGGVGDYPYYRAVAFGKKATGTASWEPDQGRYYDFEGQPTPSMLTWYPSVNAGDFTGMVQGPWSVTGNADYVVMGGEFTVVNGQRQQGLVRFATGNVAEPKLVGPSRFNAGYPIRATSTETGTVRLSWTTNQDLDNADLEYRVYRDSKAAANRVATRTLRADFWNPLGMTATDRGLTPGATHQYLVEVRDRSGNLANSPWTPVTVATTGSPSAYREAVHGDEPNHWWRFDEQDGSAADAVGFRPLSVGGGVAQGMEGALGSEPGHGATFTGTAGSTATTTVADDPPDLFTVEAWFRTTASTGGRIVGRDTGGSRAKVDRLLSLDAEGRVVFGVKPNAARATVQSSQGYRDGRWHHAAAVLSPAGMRLYVDGAQVAQRADVTVGEHLALGYWRVGGGSAVADLPGALVGDVDEVAVYHRALSAAEIAEHVAAAGTSPEPTNQRPTVSATASTRGLTASFTTTAADPDGTVAGYQWAFGDGTTSTGANPTHTYATGGVYTARVTVTDDRGAKAATSVDVRPVLAPTASFTVAADGLAATFTSTSTDPDGTIASYQWSFGDGATSGRRGRATQPHTYAAEGTYDVTLTVTDDDGETAALTRKVTLPLPPPPPPPPPSAAPVGTRTTIAVRSPGSRRSKGTLRVGHRRPVVVLATVTPRGRVSLGGSVRILDRGRLVAVRALRGTGPRTLPRTLRLRLRGLSRGTHRLRVVYSGSATTRGSGSRVVVVRVVRRP